MIAWIDKWLLVLPGIMFDVWVMLLTALTTTIVGAFFAVPAGVVTACIYLTLHPDDDL